ncbi:hypothetical protein PMZ80_008755 [Knufia obscura]|uniref:non-specific serine/threonine protein kinase n=1 Tax=Knufia obscura TaxID=1635080 RepID=A0ABR0RD51_9EURO|nr:hypothetical protein PMZ80_008755 [Knufia obscura]
MSDHHNLMPAGPGFELVEHYIPGGFHPIQLGDKLKHDRYHIRHKLGYGHSSTVWLAYDNSANRYVAVKVICACSSSKVREIAIHRFLALDEERYVKSPIIKLLDRFKVHGPNGSHICLVLELQGPSLDSLHGTKIQPKIVRMLVRQLSEGIEFLHRRDVAFGDLWTANILLGLVDINDLSETSLHEKLGKPVTKKMNDLIEDEDFENAPEVVYRCVDFSKLDLNLLIPRIILTDLNEAVLTSDTTIEHDTTINILYASPENVLEVNQTHSKASDIWALACCFYEMRARQLLFPLSDDPDSAAFSMQHLIGPIPDELFQQADPFDEIEQLTEDDLADSKTTLRHKLAEIGDWNPWHTMTHEERWENMRFFLRDKNLDINKLSYNMEDRINAGPPPPAKLSEEEFADLYDLLSKMLQWRPEDRLAIEKVLAHLWLNREYKDNDDPSAPWIQRYDVWGRKYKGRKVEPVNDASGDQQPEAESSNDDLFVTWLLGLPVPQ